MKIIGICGWARSGKDTVADLAQQILPDCMRYSLAEPVKSIAQGRMGWNGDKDERGRQLLLDIGMAGRAYNPDVWLQYARTRAHVWSHAHKYLLIPDVRFTNEADWVMANGSLLKVVRDGVEQIDHQSEKELDDYLPAGVIVNNGTFEDLKVQVRQGLKRLGYVE